MCVSSARRNFAGAGDAMLPDVQLLWRRRHGIGHGGLEGLETSHQQAPPLLPVAHGKLLTNSLTISLIRSLTFIQSLSLTHSPQSHPGQ